MKNRYALIRYTSPDGTSCIGSGMLVRDRVVLTADHIASGSAHEVQFINGNFTVKEILRSGDENVDLAILVLPELRPELQNSKPITSIPYAQIDRSRPAKIDNCIAVGFAHWNRDSKGPTSLQVEGYVRTAEGLHMHEGGADGEWLTLVSDRIPPDTPGDNPWGGMSGAAVVSHDQVIGVIRSHNFRKGPESLTVTPLTALKWLSLDIQDQFCNLLGIRDLNEIPVFGSNYTSELTSEVATFGAEIRDHYREILVQADLDPPIKWNESELDNLRRSYMRHDTVADLLEALLIALRALPVLSQIGGHEIGIRKLTHLYRRHVGRWPSPRQVGREEMLVTAASSWITERRNPTSSGKYQLGPPCALARFILGIFGHKYPSATLLDPQFSWLTEWLTGPLGQQLEDAENYLTDKVGGKSWALIEFGTEESNSPDPTTQVWPDSIVVNTVTEHGLQNTIREPCAVPSEDGIRATLRDVISNHLPDGEVVMDLVMPRYWLDRGVERWHVVPVLHQYESLARHYHPHLRWSMHHHDQRLRARLKQRFSKVDWLTTPELIPTEVISNSVRFSDWLEEWDDRMHYPPYFTGTSIANQSDYDPLTELLREGYGTIIWFPSDTTEDVIKKAADAASLLNDPNERRHDLPQQLAVQLKAHHPTIIWVDPDGRAEFPLPVPRNRGSRRGGTA